MPWPRPDPGVAPLACALVCLAPTAIILVVSPCRNRPAMPCVRPDNMESDRRAPNLTTESNLFVNAYAAWTCVSVCARRDSTQYQQSTTIDQPITNEQPTNNHGPTVQSLNHCTRLPRTRTVNANTKYLMFLILSLSLSLYFSIYLCISISQLFFSLALL